MTRRALILGAAGFLGSHLSRHLLRSGWSVTGLVRNRESPEVGRRLGDIALDLKLVQGDIGDFELMTRLVRPCDAVFSFAGRSGAAASMLDPLADLSENAAALLSVLEAVRACDPAIRLVFPGSRLQYGRPMVLPVTEDHPQIPASIYGAHKVLGERYHDVYRQAYGLHTTVLRISIPYGPYQDREDARFGVVGTFLARASRGLDITLYGDGSQRRDFLYIDDLCDLCERAAIRPEAVGEAFNASGPRPVPLREMAETVVDVVGSGRVLFSEWPATEAAIETGDYYGSTDKAERLLGWRPKVELRPGLEATWSSRRVAGALN